MQIYFDGEEEPRVEVPVGPFFGIHHGQPYHLAHSKGPGKIIGLTLGLRQFDPADAWYHCGGNQSHQQRNMTIRIGHDDWFRLGVNGQLEYDGEQFNGFHTREIVINLKKGKNQLLLKAANKDNTNFHACPFLFDPDI